VVEPAGAKVEVKATRLLVDPAAATTPSSAPSTSDPSTALFELLAPVKV
jgi:hypothetical protein